MLDQVREGFCVKTVLPRALECFLRMATDQRRTVTGAGVGGRALQHTRYERWDERDGNQRTYAWGLPAPLPRQGLGDGIETDAIEQL